MIPNPNSILQNQQSKDNRKANFFLDSEEMWKLQKETFFYWSCTNILLLTVVTYITRDKLVERTERAVWGAHLSHVNTQISSSLTKVMVPGVSLNNPAVDACDSESSTLKRTTKTRRASSLMFCSIFQRLQHNRQKNNKATRSRGLSERRRISPPSSSQGTRRKYAWTKLREQRKSQTFCVLTSD